MSEAGEGVFHREELFAWDKDEERERALSTQVLEPFSVGEWAR